MEDWILADEHTRKTSQGSERLKRIGGDSMSQFTCPFVPPPAAHKWESCVLSWAQFLITRQSGTTHPPAICCRYGENYGRMSRQFPDNRQCCKETIVLSALFLFSFVISADGGTFHSASSMAPSSDLEPIILCPGPVEIQFHHQSVEPAIKKTSSSPLESISFNHAPPAQCLFPC